MSVVELVPPSVRLSKRALQSWYGGEPELRLIPRLCRRDEWALDIGANYGVYAWHLARWSAGVVAFEPQPALAQFAAKALGARIQVEQVALSNTDGEVTLRIPTDRMLDGCATIEPTNALAQIETSEIRVPRRRLDSYALGPVALIKVDVEGHELAVLEGGAVLLARDRPTLIVEAEERHRPGAVETLRSYLATFGYRGYFCRQGGLHLLDGLAGAGAGDVGQAAAAQGLFNFVFVARTNVLADLTGQPETRPGFQGRTV